ncbi:MAG: DUF4430 domain-containing protein [Agathobacter sp.]|nr:DUF4430 domain-containing protein [Agathobacter sp.]
MQKKWNNKLLSLILSTMLIVAMAFSMTACGGNDTDKETPNVGAEGQNVAGTENDAPGDAQDEQGAQTDAKVLGEGKTVFAFVVVDGEGNEHTFEIHTDKTTVGAALLEVKLIEGEDGPYGLYVKSVNGITADYDVDGTYWAFYINDEMAMTGVDATDVEAGATYSFKVEK